MSTAEVNRAKTLERVRRHREKRRKFGMSELRLSLSESQRLLLQVIKIRRGESAIELFNQWLESSGRELGITIEDVQSRILAGKTADQIIEYHTKCSGDQAI